MYYLTTHSTQFIYGYIVSEYMIKDNSDNELNKNVIITNMQIFGLQYYYYYFYYSVIVINLITTTSTILLLLLLLLVLLLLVLLLKLLLL